METLLYFVLPADRHLPSGGNIYNEKLIEALNKTGGVVKIIDFSSYQQAVIQDYAGYYWVDSLFIKQMQTLLPARPRKAKSICVLHHLESLSPPQGKTSDAIFEELEKAVLQFFHGFLVTSSFSEKYLRSRGMAQPVMVVEPATEVMVSPSLPHSKFVRALMVANVIARKGILEWLNALGKTAHASDEFILTIAGRTDMEPAYANACRDAVTSQPVLQEKVRFTDEISHQLVLAQYSQSDLFVSAATMETFGMALQEAVAFHIPILGIDGGYVKNHVVPGKNGYIFKSTAEMAKFFIDLVRDQVKFAALREAALQDKRPAYTWHQAAFLFFQQFRSLFKNL